MSKQRTTNLELVCSYIACVIAFAAYRNEAVETQRLRNYVEQSQDPATRQQAQIDYFGHDVKSPQDLFDELAAEAWQLKRRQERGDFSFFP